MFLFVFFHLPILIINRVSCSKSTRPVANNLIDDGLETYALLKQRFAYASILRTSNLLELFMFELKTRLPACPDHNETLPSSFNTDALGRSGMLKATETEIIFVCDDYIKRHNNILNFIGVSSIFSTIVEAEFRRDEFVSISQT